MRSQVHLVSIGGPDAPGTAAGRTNLAPRDADELAILLEQHAAIEVWFPSLAVFLETLWSGRVPASVWRRVRISFGDTRVEGAGKTVEETLTAWESFTRAANRRRCAAALVLSVIAMAAAATVLWFS